MTNTAFGVPHQARPAGEVAWPWVVWGVLQLLAAAPMLMMMAGNGLVTGLMALGVGAYGGVVAMVLMLISGPVLGLAVPALMLLVPAVRRANRYALFALHATGLLCGTAIEFFLWVVPAMG
ncbi:hypothetical protein AB0D04_14495 [Streptomyces sp. NPDC048483]|uniref:hypothetical protein n=1 Tax=Streptomyces sp. NPDC048483 TaxID=3154927 RepID=UPI0034188348